MLILFASACGTESRTSTRGADEEPGAWSEGQAWRLVELATIGAADGEGPEVFANVADVSLDPLGRVWIADGHAQELRVFDENGTHVRTLGGKGGGPGEFGSIAGMQWAPDGRLWVMDAANARYTVYDTAGTMVDTRPRKTRLGISPWPARFDSQGRLYDIDATRMNPDGSIATSIVRDAAGGAEPETFQLPPAEEEMFVLKRGDARNQHFTRVNVPFAGMQFWALGPDGSIWIANTEQYRIERHAFDGSVASVVTRRHTPVPVTRAERDRELEG